MKKPFLLLLLAITSAGYAHAQSIGPGTLNAAGGTAVIGANEFDWSVGEMTMVTTGRGADSSIVVTQGVLQPAGFSNESVHNTSLLASQLQVFPNPATSIVNIQYTSSALSGTLTYKLTDVLGQVIMNRTTGILQGKTSAQVNVSDLANATYMLEVTVNPGAAASESMTYKIEKLN